MSDLYETDIVSWSEGQAALLHRRAAGELVNDAELDWPNIAEEIEALARSERSKLRNHIATVIEHLIKLQASPATDPRNGWKISIRRTRRDIERTLKDSPSLRREVADMIVSETPDVQADVAASMADDGEQPLVDVKALAFTETQLLGDWFPSADPDSNG